MSVGMAEVFQTPVAPSTDVLMIVAMRKTRLRRRRMKGNVSHSQCIETYVSLRYASPWSIYLLSAERMTFVIAVARRSMCRDTLFGASQGLKSRMRFHASPLLHILYRNIGELDKLVPLDEDVKAGKMS
jgi:hypothetical protein